MAIHMALGLVFLGGGELTLSRSNEAIAALVMSLFPRFPAHSQDNQYHLQPLRHLYVLAAEPRSFLAFDVDSGRPVFVPIEITTVTTTRRVQPQPPQPPQRRRRRGGGRGQQGKMTRWVQRLETRELVAPCLLTNEVGSIVRLRVKSPRYYSLCLWPRRFVSHARAIAGTFCIII